MKAIVFALFAVALATNFEAYGRTFEQFSIRYGKNYVNEAEKLFRQRVFAYNMEWAEKINKSQDSFTVGANVFADMTNQEFANSKLCGCMIKPKMSSKPATPIMLRSVEEIDWRDKGAVSPVKNQKSCGSCWAFSAVGALEGGNFVQTGELLRFSEQQLVDCDPQSEGCNGGLMTWAFEYVMEHGLCLEDDYPYTGRDEDCKDDKCKPAVHIKGYEETPEDDGRALKLAIAEAPISVAVQADSAVFQMYTGGILDSEKCGTALNHGITAVGYGVDYVTCKNSWGGTWGDKGYIKIKFVEKGKGICGLNMMNSYPTF